MGGGCEDWVAARLVVGHKGQGGQGGQGKAVEVGSVEAFFAELSGSEDAGRYAELRRVLSAAPSDLAVRARWAGEDQRVSSGTAEVRFVGRGSYGVG